MLSWDCILGVDSYAWIEYLNGTKAGLKVKRILEAKNNTILTTCINLVEVVSKAKREGKDADFATNALLSLSRVLAIGTRQARNAGMLHAEMRRKIADFGLADAFVLAIAREQKAKIVTGDEHFRNVNDSVMIR